MYNANQGIKEIEISAKVTRANGEVEELGTIALYKYKVSFLHRIINFLRRL